MTDEAKRCVAALRTCCLPQNIQPVAFFVCADCSGYEPDVPCQINLTAADLIESLSAELEQVKRERDALMTDLSKSRLCRTCVFYGDGDYISNDCFDCVNRCNWQWRGVKEDRTS